MKTNNEEAIRMVHESLANNSALALTIDCVDSSNRRNINLTAKASKNALEKVEEDKGEQPDLEELNYVCNEARISQLDINQEKEYEMYKYADENCSQIQKGDCRICLQEGEILGEKHTNYDELLVANPCKCSGYIHVTCLREWLKVHR